MRSFLLLLVFGVVLTVSAVGQDLGSSNQLFGGKKAAPKTAAKKAANKPRTPSPKTKAVAKKTPPAVSKPKQKTGATTAQSPGKKVFKPVGATSTRTTKNVTTARNEPKKEAPVRPRETPPKLDVRAAQRYEDLIADGNDARDSREYAAAETAYQRARAINPYDGRAEYGLGNLYSDQQRWEEAETAYRKALELSPKDGAVHIALSYVLTQPVAAPSLGDRYEEAEQLARKANELLPRNALALDQLGVAMELRGLIGPETETAYRKATLLDPSFAPPYAHLGRLLRRRGMSAESAAAYKKATSLASDVPTNILIAEVLQSEQRFAESEPLLKTALNGDPRNPAALLLMARALSVRGAFGEAEATVRKALLVSPNSFEGNSLLASIHFRQGHYEMTEAALMQASRYVSVFDKGILVKQYEQLGNAYRTAGRTAQSQRMFQRAAALTADERAIGNRNKPE